MVGDGVFVREVIEWGIDDVLVFMAVILAVSIGEKKTPKEREATQRAKRGT